MGKKNTRLPLQMIREFFKLEGAAAILLGIATIIAMVMKNSPIESLYNALLTTPVVFQIGEFIINKPLLLWINDGLMAIFFLLVTLEIKREILEGQLSKFDQISLPAMAAFGGVVVPALIYTYFNLGDSLSMQGWAIPAATDIAFSLGLLFLLGGSIPETLKICLVAIAILDDLVAIVIIALFYTKDLSMFSMAIGFICIAILLILNQRGVSKLAPYIVTGIVLWACVLKSGVHATLAGVILAAFIPLKIKNNQGIAPLRKLEHELHPWIAFGVLPIFAFANAGVSLRGLSLDLFMQPITLGIAAGLFFGKQLGVMVMTAFGVMFKICKLPKGVNWKQYYGMALITGVGFTMSLFIGTLAFYDVDRQTQVRLGVLVGSILSGLLGYLMLRITSKIQIKKDPL